MKSGGCESGEVSKKNKDGGDVFLGGWLGTASGAAASDSGQHRSLDIYTPRASTVPRILGSRAVGHNVPNKRLNINFIINEHLRVGHTEGKLARHTIAMSRWMGNRCSVNVTGAGRKTSRLKSPRIYRPPYQTPTPPSSILCLELNMYPHSISMAIYTNSTRYVYITKCSILQVRRY
jgi:hypothetical protein